jgi:hypothetical protein
VALGRGEGRNITAPERTESRFRKLDGCLGLAVAVEALALVAAAPAFDLISIDLRATQRQIDVDIDSVIVGTGDEVTAHRVECNGIAQPGQSVIAKVVDPQKRSASAGSPHVPRGRMQRTKLI